MTTCRFVASDEPRILPGRHVTDCAGETCSGCLPCTEPHCGTCRRAHADVTCAECIAATRDDLHTIAAMCDALPEEAEHRGINGEAMMLLGPSADPEAWRNRAMSAMRGRLDAAYLEDCRDEQHPTWVLGTWEQAWRDHLDQPTELAATLPRLVAYLDRQMHVMAEVADVPFEDFARDLRGCRGHLEDVLHDGEQIEQTRVPCLNCGTHLVVEHGATEDDDHWRCPRKACNREHRTGEFALAKFQQLSSEGAERFVHVSDALAAIDRPEQTLRTWMRNGEVRTQRDDSTGRVHVWWPDVREMHMSKPTRRRAQSA